MKTISCFFAAAVFLFSCGNEVKKAAVSPIGKFQSEVPWENNDITVTVRPDSMILFKAKKLFCPGTKYFVSVGKWHVEKDSFLVMEQYKNGKKFDLKDVFPELTKLQQDSSNVIGIDVEARFIFNKDHLYNIAPDGKRAKGQVYIKKSS